MEPPVATCRRTIVTGTVCGLPATTGDCGRHNRPAGTTPPPPAVAAACATVAQGPTGWSQQLAALTSSPHTSAWQVADWWAALPPDTQAQASETRFEQLGNLDGIPLDIRDAANRRTLERWFSSDGFRRLSATEQDVHVAMSRGAVPMVDPASGQVLLRRSQLHTFAPDSGRIAYLLTADTGQPPSQVTVMVPGTRAQLVNFPVQYERAVAFDQTVRGRHPGFAVDGATLMWLGYRAPRRLPNALLRRYAARGRDQLASTVDGLRATGASEVTVVGHSYGARVALEAAARSAARIDQVVLVAPPGEGPAGTVAQAVERTGRDVHVVMYRRDFLSRDWRGGPKPAATAPVLRPFHGRKVSPGPGVQVHVADGPTAVDGRPVGKGRIHSAYFADPATAAVLADVVAVGHTTRILR